MALNGAGWRWVDGAVRRRTGGSDHKPAAVGQPRAVRLHLAAGKALPFTGLSPPFYRLSLPFTAVLPCRTSPPPRRRAAGRWGSGCWYVFSPRGTTASSRRAAMPSTGCGCQLGQRDITADRQTRPAHVTDFRGLWPRCRSLNRSASPSTRGTTPPLWLRHRLCLTVPPPSWLRHRLCRVSPLPFVTGTRRLCRLSLSTASRG